MTHKRVKFHPEAAEEFVAAAVWYESRRGGLGEEFILAAEVTIDRIVEQPGIGRAPPGVSSETNVRRLLFHKFPYSIVYVESNDELIVLAYAHGHRKPGYWRHRLSGH